MSETEIKVPNIGDFKDVEVIEVLVSEGQSIKKNDALITIESDKSSVEIPSNLEGKIKNLKIKVGDKVSEGDLILTVESDLKVKKEEVKEKLEIEKESKNIEVIKPEIQEKTFSKNNISDISSASPKARKFARELGVDINQVVGSQKDGRVVEDDIKKFVSSNSKNTVVTKDKKLDAQRNMAWFALGGMLLYPAFVIAATLFGLDNAAKILGDMAAVYFVSVAAIVAAFYGKEALAKKK